MGMHQGCVLPFFLFAVFVDVVAEFALSELLFVDELDNRGTHEKVHKI